MQNTGLTVIIVVGCIVLFVALIALFYMIVAYRRITIVAKKLDYLIEDISYKTELLTPVVDNLVKLSNRNDLVDAFIANKQVSNTKNSANQAIISRLEKNIEKTSKSKKV
ncbi:MAG: hypothetical protein LBT77_02075 [Mycoplasmataceae bacterium]|jgi:hypothetical protein|nr:hypothetical protein [Mycoplasmataceae bacterium]